MCNILISVISKVVLSCLLSTPQTPIDVTLSPPPDLVVSSIAVGQEHTTGSVMVIRYTVTNNGAGAPFEPFWTDRTVSWCCYVNLASFLVELCCGN